MSINEWMKKEINPWMGLTIDGTDTNTRIEKIDYRVFVYPGTGNIYEELSHLALEKTNEKIINFPILLTINNGVLNANFQLKKKSSNQKFLDLRRTIITYKSLPSIFLSLNLIGNIYKNNILKNKFDGVKQDVFKRANFLEYYILNNSSVIINSRNYIDVKLEYDLYKMFQDLYLLAKNGESFCSWVLSFDTPLQLWFVYVTQNLYLQWQNSIIVPSMSRRASYEESKKLVDINPKQYLEEIKNYQGSSNVDIHTAVNYTLKQLGGYSRGGLGNYEEYLRTLNKLAREIYTGKRRRI